MSSVYWVAANGELMEYDGKMPPRPVIGIQRSEVLTLDEAKKKYPEFFPPDILDKLEDLHKQATTERSHHYVASCVKEAIAEIKRLREIEWMYKDLG